MYWMDADTVTFECVPHAFLESLLPEDVHLSSR
jgi:hypothetical protein